VGRRDGIATYLKSSKQTQERNYEAANRNDRAAVMLGTATSLFAQTSGVAVGGGAAGGPNGIYKDPYGYNGNNTYQAIVQRKRR
jgi:hypothetical protein